ncbi:MAG: hypothetical protein RIS86_715 [Planctomycetota bacterium]
MQRIVIIDVGSNTAKLIALAFTPGYAWRQLDELRAVVRLSEGLDDGGALRPGPFARGLAALRTFASYAAATGVDRVVASATSAVRDAVNGAEFIAAARSLGIDLQVLGGVEEAHVAARAVVNGLDVIDGVTLDVGGGSFQLSQIVGRRWRRGASWPLGAVRAHERYLKGDPPRPKGVRGLRDATEAAVRSFWREGQPPATLAILGGTARNLANVHQKRIGYPLDLLHAYRMPVADLVALSDELLSLEVDARAALPGLNRDRADIIAAGATVIAEVARTLGVTEVSVSGQGLREGLFYPFLLPDAPDHLFDDVRGFSILNLMRQYHDEPGHNGHVRHLALALFDATRPWHPFGTAERDLLGYAAWVHDIGMAVDYYRHEHHGMALALGRALPGFDHREQVLIALLVRFHRKGAPSLAGYEHVLAPDDLARLRLLAGLLRLAEYLERGKAQRVDRVDVRVEADGLHVLAFGSGDVHVEVEAANARRDLLEGALGRSLRVVDAADVGVG